MELDIKLHLHRRIKVRSLWPKWVKAPGHYDEKNHKIEDIIEERPSPTDDEVNDLLREHGWDPANPLPED